MMKKTILGALINKAIAVITVCLGVHFLVSYLNKVLPFGLELSLDTSAFGTIIWFIWGYGGLFISIILIVCGIKNFIGKKLLNKILL